MKRRVLMLVLACVAFAGASAQIVDTKKEDGKWGFVDKNGQWIISPRYYYVYWSKDNKRGEFQVASGDDTRGMIDESGRIIYRNGKYRSFFRLSISGKLSDLVTIESTNGKKGIGNMSGKILIPCQYDEIIGFMNWFSQYPAMTLRKNGLKGLANVEGKVVLQCQYQDITPGVEAAKPCYTVTNQHGKQGVYSCTGEEIVPVEFDSAVPQGELVWTSKKVGTKELRGMWSLAGKEIVPCKFHVIWDEEKYLRVTTYDDLNGIYTYDGKILVPCEYNNLVVEAADGIFLVQKGAVMKDGLLTGGKYGYYANGKEIIPCIYDEASVFTNDVAKVKKDGEVSLIKNPLKDGGQIMIAGNAPAPNKKKVGSPAVSRYPAPDSDVDKNIPMAKRTAENTFAFIIANENYPDAPVPYSLNDGRMFREYCQKTLGLPEKNINLYEDATFGNIITAVEKMKQVADAYDGEASVIFYYAGHGFPDDKQATAYLLPIDGDASNITTTGYSLAKLYKEISQLKLKSSVVFLDACFSGAKREDQMLASSRGVAIKVKEEAPQGNMVVFSAAQGDETAHQMEEKHHGLFTYFLLKELQATGGDVDMGTLTEYVTKQVKRQSVVINNKKQTPTVIPSQALTNSWQTMKLK